MTSALKLYEIADELRDIEDALIEAEGELTPEIEARMEAAEMAFEDKVRRICEIRQNMLRTAEAYQAEIDRLSVRVRGLGKSADSLKGYLFEQMERAGKQKIEVPPFRLAIQPNGRPSIRWTLNPEAAPERFRRVDVRIDGDAAYREWRETGELPEGFLVDIGRHLRVR